MSELFATGRVVDLILALMGIEVAALVALRLRSGRGIAPRALVGNILAGAFLLLALRGALLSVAWPWIACCLVGALIAHLVDVWSRMGA
jgi:hypothetical protein